MFKRIFKYFLISLSILTARVVYAGYDFGQVMTSPLTSRRFLANNGGLVNHISPLLVPDNSASAIENISMDDRGDLIKRNGYTIIQSTSALAPVNISTWAVLGGGYHKSSSGSDFFGVIVGSNVYTSSNTFLTWNINTGTAVITNNWSNLAQTTNFNDGLIFCLDVDTPVVVTSKGQARAITTGGTFSAAKTCATYGNYLIAANTVEGGTNYPTRLRWSDINTYDSWPTLNYTDVEFGDGDAIVSVVAFDESVYIFKQRSIYQLLITGNAGANAFFYRPVSRNIGAWAKNSVRVIPNVGIAFLAQNTAYLLNDSGLKPIGDPIQRTFDSIQRNEWSQAVAGVYPKKYQYWLSVSTAGASNTEVLVYDYIQKNWTIYDDMTLSMIEQAQNSTGDNILLSGGYTNTVWQQDNGTVDQSTSTAGNAITATYTTGQLFADSTDITKNFKYLYLVTSSSVNYTISVNAAYDLNNTYEYQNTFQIGTSGSLYDVGTYDSASYLSGSNIVNRIELNRSAQTLKLQFKQTDTQGSFGIIGWTVVYSIEGYRQDY